MFITGPEVIKTVTHEEVTKEELGGATTHATQERRLRTSPRPTSCTCIAQAPRAALVHARQQHGGPAASGRRSDPPIAPTPALDTIVPLESNKPYDIKEIIRAVVDDGQFFEVHEDYAKNIVVGFARFGGRAGRHRREPAGAPRGLPRHRRVDRRPRGSCGSATASTSRSSRSSTCPASCPGTNQEYGGIIKHGAKLLYAFAEATVPKITVITRKAYGGAYDVMASKHIRADVNVAYPAAEIAVMGPEGAVNIIYRSELDKIADETARAEARAEFIDEYRETFANPYKAAVLGYIDEIIRAARHALDDRAVAAHAEEQAPGEPAAQARQHPARRSDEAN